MGNTPSHEVPSRKLSKPRTVNYPTAGLSSSNGSSPDSSARFSSTGLVGQRYSSYSNPSPLGPSPSEDRGNDDLEGTENTPPPRPTPQRRRSLFRSNSSQHTSERRTTRRNTIVGTPSSIPDGNMAMARSHSMSTHDWKRNSRYESPATEDWPLAGSRTSCAYNLTSYETQRLLHLTNKNDLPPVTPQVTRLSEHRREEVCEVTWKSSHPTQDSTPITRAHSDISLHPPVRRRSIIQTPGVATRTRPPPLSNRSSFRHSHPPTPNLSRQVSFESNGDRVLSMPTSIREHVDMPRLLTPSDGEYRATGAFKLGSLRITNGSPVLTPRTFALPKVADEQSTTSGVERREDYFSVAQPGGPGMTEDPASPPLTTRRHVTTFSGASEAATSVLSSRGSGNVANVAALAVATNVQQELVTRVQPSSLDVQPKSANFDSLQTTSKHTAFEDDLFGIEDNSDTDISAIEVLDVRIDPNAKALPPLPLTDTTQKTDQGVIRSDSGFESVSVSESSKSHHSSLAKADSGYSSNVSLQSLKKSLIPSKDAKRTSAESTGDSLKIPEQSSIVLPHVNPPTSNPSSSGDVPSNTQDKSPTPLPKDRGWVQVSAKVQGSDYGMSRLRETVQRARSIPTRKSVRRDTPSPINSTRSTDRSIKSPDTLPLSPASAKSDESASSLSIGSSPQKPGKLQRFFSFTGSPFSKAPLTVTVTHVLDDMEVPPIPQDIEAKLRERAGLFPMTTKRLALKNQPSKDTLKTILSVGSLEITNEDEFAPTLAVAEEEDEDGVSSNVKENSLMQTLHSMQSSVRQVAASVMPLRKPVAGKPVSQRADHVPAMDAETTTCSYGSISNVANAQGRSEDQSLFFSSNGRASRAMSVTTGYENQVARSYSLSRIETKGKDMALSPTILSPISRGMSPLKKDRAPPPVSMTTRKSFRTAASASPNSASHDASSSKTSREYFNIYRPEQGNLKLRRREHLDAAPPIPPMSPRRSVDRVRRVQQVPNSQYRAPNWDPQTDPTSFAPRPLSVDYSRHNSLPSVQSDFIARTTSTRQSSPSTHGPALKYRASYDGSGHRQLGMGGRYFTYPGHQVPRVVPKPSYDQRHPPHVNPQGQQWAQQGSQPPQAPRAQHHRNKSRHGAVGNPPYRILHSYNSPAYRNVPIWG